MPATLNITAANGVPFTIVYIPAGVAGPNPARTPANSVKSTVEFYDARYPHTEFGQFTGGYYYVGTLLGTDGYGRGHGGLCLDGGQASVWSLDAASMDVVRTWLRDLENALTDLDPTEECPACGAAPFERCNVGCLGQAALADAAADATLATLAAIVDRFTPDAHGGRHCGSLTDVEIAALRTALEVLA